MLRFRINILPPSSGYPEMLVTMYGDPEQTGSSGDADLYT